MPDISDQLETWAAALAESAAPVGIDTVTGRPMSSAAGSNSTFTTSRRWMAVAASVGLVVGGIAAAIYLGGRGDRQVRSAASSVDPATLPTSTATSSFDDESDRVAVEHVVIVDGEPVGDTWVTGLAGTDAELEELWARVGFSEPRPTVDFARDVVVYFGPAESSSCRFGPLAGVFYDPTSRRVFPDLELSDVASSDGTYACTTDANPHAVVVSIARDDLPAGVFEFWVDDDDPPACCTANVTRANGDELRASPATTATTATTPSATTTVAIACRGELDAASAFSSFIADMIAARTSGEFSLVADCMSGVPPIFDGIAPGCWTACDRATITFPDDPDRFAAGGDGSGGAWFLSLPVSHVVNGDFVDVLESWTMRSTSEGWLIEGPTIERSFIERSASLEVINRYLDAIERGDWETAASMLDDGAVNPEERPDLQELAPATYDKQEVARALARWCAAGCDTTKPTAAELTFDGNYELRRGDRTITAVWYEGTYSISGLPFPRKP